MAGMQEESRSGGPAMGEGMMAADGGSTPAKGRGRTKKRHRKRKSKEPVAARPRPALESSSASGVDLEYAALLFEKSANPDDAAAASSLAEDELDHAVALFAAYDRDHNGVLDARDYAPLAHSILLSGRHVDAWPLHVRALFHKHDMNHDQQVDFLEFIQGHVGGTSLLNATAGAPAAPSAPAAAGQSGVGAARSALEAMLSEFADEGLSAPELAEAAAAFRKAETRGDGTLSAKENRNLLARLAPDVVEAAESPATTGRSVANGAGVLLDAADLNGDRRVDFLELVRQLADRKKVHQERAAAPRRPQPPRPVQTPQKAPQPPPPQPQTSDSFLTMLEAAEARDSSVASAHRVSPSPSSHPAPSPLPSSQRQVPVPMGSSTLSAQDVLYRESLRERLETAGIDRDEASAELALALVVKFDVTRSGWLRLDAWHDLMGAHDAHAERLHGAQKLSTAERRAIFAVADTSGDGALSPSELIIFLALPPSTSAARAFLFTDALAASCGYDLSTAEEGDDKAARRRQRRSHEHAAAQADSFSASAPKSSSRHHHHHHHHRHHGRRESGEGHSDGGWRRGVHVSPTSSTRGGSPAGSSRRANEGSSMRRGGSSVRRSGGTSSASGEGIFGEVMSLAANRGAAMVAHAVQSAPGNLNNTNGISMSNMLNCGLGQARSSASGLASSVTSSTGGDYLPMPSLGNFSLSSLAVNEHAAEMQATAMAYTPVAGLRAAHAFLSSS